LQKNEIRVLERKKSSFSVTWRRAENHRLTPPYGCLANRAAALWEKIDLAQAAHLLIWPISVCGGIICRRPSY
jgi:hypothetical protein